MSLGRHVQVFGGSTELSTEIGGCAVAVAKASHQARKALEPDGCEVFVRHERARTRPVGRSPCVGVPGV